MVPVAWEKSVWMVQAPTTPVAVETEPLTPLSTLP